MEATVLNIGSVVISLCLIIFFIAMISTHLLVAYRLGRKFAASKALLVLIAVAIVTTVIWLFVFWLATFFAFMSSIQPDWFGVFLVTFGLPSYVPCALFTWLPRLWEMSDYTTCSIYLVLFMVLSIYVVGLLPLMYAIRRDRVKTVA